MKDLGNTIYSFGCVVAATVLGIGVADYWFGCIPLLGGIGGHSLASRPRIFVRSGSSLGDIDTIFHAVVGMKLVTSYLVVHKGQIPCKRYCKLGHQTPYSRHQQRRGPCYKLPNERWRRDASAWSQLMTGRRCREQ